MAKTISLKNSNLHILGSGLDANGNKIIKLGMTNMKRGISIQTNGNLPKTNRTLSGLKTVTEIKKHVSKTDLAIIEKEVIGYIKRSGSDLQQEKLRYFGAWC